MCKIIQKMNSFEESRRKMIRHVITASDSLDYVRFLEIRKKKMV